MNINFFGLFNSPVSWAKILRNSALNTMKLGYEVNITPRKGYFYQSALIDPRLDILARANRYDKADIQIAFEYPGNYKLLTGKFKVGLLVYETDVLPVEWAENINKYLDLVIVPSTFCYHIFKNSAVTVPIEIVPYGVETDKYKVAEKSSDRFTLLHIALPHKRKATPFVINAFSSAFQEKEDTTLIIKLPGIRRAKALWEENIDFSGLPENIKIIADILTEEQMVSLFQNCDIFLQPSYSEGFGMAILEAFSCGKAAVITGYGGQMDFCSKKNSFILPYSTIPANEIQYDIKHLTGKAKVAQPDFDTFIQILIKAYTHPAILSDKSRFCRKTARNYDWLNITKKLIATIFKQLGAIGK